MYTENNPVKKFTTNGDRKHLITTLEQSIKEFYEPYDKLGFKFKCKIHSHLNNNDDYMKIHLFKDHDLYFPLKNWHKWFTLFTVGDSYSSEFRCNFCNQEFIFEKDAIKHIEKHLDHSIKRLVEGELNK